MRLTDVMGETIHPFQYPLIPLPHELVLLPHVHEELVRISGQYGIKHPVDHLVIALHAVVQKEEVNVSLEGSEEIEESLVLFDAPSDGAVLPVVEVLDALEGQIPSVLYAPIPKREFLFSVILSGVYAKMIFVCTPILAFSSPENVFIFITH